MTGNLEFHSRICGRDWWEKNSIELKFICVKFVACIISIVFVCSISHFATADEFTDTTLRILTAEKRQYGQYYCRAANKLGTDQASVELFGTKTIQETLIR